MNGTLLVMQHELRQVAATRSFWLTILLPPIMIGLGFLSALALDRSDVPSLLIIDRAGGTVATGIERRIARDHGVATIEAIARYRQRHAVAVIVPGTEGALAGAPVLAQDVLRFEAAGGTAAAIDRLAAGSGGTLPRFTPPAPVVRLVPPMPAFAGSESDKAIAGMDAITDAGTGAGGLARLQAWAEQAGVEHVLVVPADFGPASGALLLSDKRLGPPAASIIRAALADALRARLLAGEGVSPGTIGRANAVEPLLRFGALAPSTSPDDGFVRKVLPMAMLYLFILALLAVGGLLLQSTLEERTNKLIEALLACIDVRQFLHGKVAAALVLGLVVMGTWGSCAAVALGLSSSSEAAALVALLRDAYRPAEFAWMVAFMLGGWIMVSALLITVGALSNSVREAQGYLGPALLLLLGPVIASGTMMAGGNELPARILTWVPLYSPSMVLLRLGGGISAEELTGAGLLLAAFTALEIHVLGRVFRASLLHPTGGSGLRNLWRRTRSRVLSRA